MLIKLHVRATLKKNSASRNALKNSINQPKQFAKKSHRTFFNFFIQFFEKYWLRLM